MSTASLVPETSELTGDDAWHTLKRARLGRILVDAFRRMRWADGFSHARSLAFMTSLTLVEGLIALVGFATAFGNDSLGGVIAGTLRAAVPGPAGQVLTAAVDHANRAGASHRYLALGFGSLSALVTATTAMGQLERGLNRIYGVEQDRPTLHKYGLALLLTASAGTLACAAFVLIGFGHAVAASLAGGAMGRSALLVGWPLGLGLMMSAMALLFRWCPRRRQPAWSWLAFGATVSVASWFVVTLALSLYFRHSRSFGDTYGPLAGLVALLLWGMLSAIVTLYGAAISAQLEAFRAGQSAPQDAGKVEASEPAAANASSLPGR